MSYRALSAEVHNICGELQAKFLQNHFIISLNLVYILPRSIADEKSQIDLLKV